jgi:hypothetical protein
VVGLATTNVHATLSDEVKAQLTRSTLESFEEIAPREPFELAIYPVASNARGVDVSEELGYVAWTKVRNVSQGQELLNDALAKRLSTEIDTVTTDSEAWWQRVLNARAGGSPPDRVLFVGSPISRGAQLDMYQWKDIASAQTAAQLGTQSAREDTCDGTVVSMLGAGSAFDPGGTGEFEPVPQVLYDNAEAYWSNAIEGCGGSLDAYAPFPP